MNKMKEVAALLGVELGEEFNLKRTDSDIADTCMYRITENKALEFQGETVGWCRSAHMGRLLAGELEIVKLPWKPKEGDKYYYNTHFGVSSHAFSTKDYFDLIYYVSGNCFRTEKEAISNNIKIREKLKKMYFNGEQI